ncbi:MAG: glycosyltransferase family 4 protein [Candidatus Berkelbacteria bacterium]
MNSKKLLMIGWFFYPKLGGAESLMLEQARFFVKAGFSVTVLTSLQDGLKPEEIFEGISIIRRDFIDSRSDTTRAIAAEFPEILDRVSPSIIHCHNFSYPSAAVDKINGANNILLMMKIAKERNIRIIEHSHNAQLNRPDQTEVLRNLGWDHIFFVSHFVEKAWLKLGFKSESYSVVHNGIKLENFSNIEPDKQLLCSKGNNILIFFPARVISMILGEISKQKNFILLLRAAEILVERNILNFKIVAVMNTALTNDSNTKGIDEVNRIIEKLNLRNYIEFLPNILPQKMPSFFSAVDIVCVPSIDETFGLVYLEAMASGKVAIASTTGGPQEFINNNESGFLVDPFDASALADILEKLINNSLERNKIGENAKIQAKNFSIENSMGKIAKIYEELI